MSFLSEIKTHHCYARPQRKSYLVGAVLGLYAAAIGCSSTTGSNESAEQSAEGTEKIEVVSTFAPITSFTKAVAGDRANVVQLLPTNISPHDYQARPEDVVRLKEADVVIENGLEFEPFLEAMIKASENQDVVVIDSSAGIEVAELDEDAHGDHGDHGDHDNHGDHDDHEDHSEHDHGDHEGEKHSEEKGEAKKVGKHSGHAHGENDPHIWLDPKRAVQQVENIRDGLIEADPEGQEVYQANAQSYIDQLQALDADITARLQPYEGQSFVTYHDFAHYFAQSYGLNAEFLVGVPSENASPEDVNRVINAVKESNLKTLLTEPQAINNPFAAIANDLQINVSQFDPMGTSSVQDIQADSYIATMRDNLENLSAAFSAQTQQSWLQAPYRASVTLGHGNSGASLLFSSAGAEGQSVSRFGSRVF